MSTLRKAPGASEERRQKDRSSWKYDHHHDYHADADVYDDHHDYDDDVYDDDHHGDVNDYIQKSQAENTILTQLGEYKDKDKYLC